MLVLDNDDGSVWLEIPGQPPHRRLADSLEALLAQIAPRVALPPMVPETAPVAAVPGLVPRLKQVWQHLRGGKRSR